MTSEKAWISPHLLVEYWTEKYSEKKSNPLLLLSQFLIPLVINEMLRAIHENNGFPTDLDSQFYIIKVIKFVIE